MLSLIVVFVTFLIARGRRKYSRKRSLAIAGAAYLVFFALEIVVSFVLFTQGF